ncbi:hypothetical protein J7E25_01160 [Agromyces sp. ISL-38]|uniref:hypothetical protein n=1 Tax=Agromyces sp. ISL-38 TaxID=2819107 RepID=UPI001BEBE98D|nr:hypothetical protein [Agromyces sp. ISL-38]MBT2497696.1 hypothetical protein [Agromyces sp. ISL-38]MBT2517220.1 hypothetical protein [Streptomyces sp. ISL-90]
MGSSRVRVGRVSPLAVAAWAGLAVLLVGAFLAALGGLNQTIYGASSFVDRYLEAIADDDIATASTTPGVALDAAELEELGLPANISTAMLRSGVVEAGPEDVRIVKDETLADGSHSVTASYRLEAAIIESTFDVRPIDPLYGFLNRWEFAVSPLAVIDVTAAHNPLFTVGSLSLDTRAAKSGEELTAFTQITSYLAMAPAVYEFHYDSTLLDAPHVAVQAEASARTSVIVDAQPTAEFVDRVQVKVDEFLQTCAQQPVLQPTDCPFGIEIDDRVVSEPKWSMVSTPVVVLTPGESSFEMPPTEGVAHMTVDVQSLFDGDFFTLEEDRPFTLALTAVIKPDGNIAIQLR